MTTIHTTAASIRAMIAYIKPNGGGVAIKLASSLITERLLSKLRDAVGTSHGTTKVNVPFGDTASEKESLRLFNITCIYMRETAEILAKASEVKKTQHDVHINRIT